MHTKNLQRKCATPAEYFKVIVLKTLRVLKVNCAKILAKMYDFMACVTSIKKELSNDV